MLLGRYGSTARLRGGVSAGKALLKHALGACRTMVVTLR
jgi:hypothetical protein